MDFNLRFSTASTVEQLQTRIRTILQRHGVEHTLQWTLGAEPFLTPPGHLSAALTQAIAQETGTQAALSTTGGTSDGRFIARICPQVVEFGPLNDSIHQVNEHIRLADLQPLKNIYRRVLEQLLPDAA